MDEPVLWLWSECLLSKWGFNDGDVPDQVLEYCDEHGVDYLDVDWDAALRALVRTHLLPELAKHHAIKVYDIETIHNPIRAESVDGVEIDDYAADPQVKLTPEGVSVPLSVVVEEMERNLG